MQAGKRHCIYPGCIAEQVLFSSQSAIAHAFRRRSTHGLIRRLGCLNFHGQSGTAIDWLRLVGVKLHQSR